MSKQKKISTPHDHLFKKALENPQAARDFVVSCVSKETLAIIRLETLELQKVEFIEKDLKKTASDVIFRVKTVNNQEAYLYFLFEHMRKGERLLPWRVHKYIIRIMDEHLLKHDTETLPLVIPIIVYNGFERYPFSLDIFDLFSPDVREQAKNTLMQPCPLLDLSQTDTKKFENNAWVSLLFNALKYGPSKKMTPKMFLPFMEVSIFSLAGKRDLGYIEVILRYLCEVRGMDSQEELWQEFEERLQPVLGEDFMISIADALRQEGMQQGMQQGMQLRDTQVAQNLLKEGFDLDMVARNTGLSIEVLRRLKAETKH